MRGARQCVVDVYSTSLDAFVRWGREVQRVQRVRGVTVPPAHGPASALYMVACRRVLACLPACLLSDCPLCARSSPAAFPVAVSFLFLLCASMPSSVRPYPAFSIRIPAL